MRPVGSGTPAGHATPTGPSPPPCLPPPERSRRTCRRATPSSPATSGTSDSSSTARARGPAGSPRRRGELVVHRQEGRDPTGSRPSADGPGRRAVLAGVLVAGVAGCGRATGPTVTPGAGTVAPAPPGDPVLGTTDEIPVGGGKVFAGQRVVVTQPAAGTFVGLSAVCTHQGCIVNSVTDGAVVCPLSRQPLRARRVGRRRRSRPAPARRGRDRVAGQPGRHRHAAGEHGVLGTTGY